MVAEGLLDRLPHRRRGGLGLGVDRLVDAEGGHEHADDGDDGEDAHGGTEAPGDAERRLEEARDRGHEVGDRGADEVGDRDVGGEVDARLLRAAELGDERVEGGAVERERDVEEHERDEERDVVHPCLAVNGRDEHHDGHDAKGNRRTAHEGDAPAERVAETVGLARDEGVDEAVEEAAAGGDDADDGESEEDGPLRDEDRHALREQRLARHVVVHEPVADDARQNGPAELANRKEPEHMAVRELLLCHTSSSFRAG